MVNGLPSRAAAKARLADRTWMIGGLIADLTSQSFAETLASHCDRPVRSDPPRSPINRVGGMRGASYRASVL